MKGTQKRKKTEKIREQTLLAAVKGMTLTLKPIKGKEPGLLEGGRNIAFVRTIQCA